MENKHIDLGEGFTIDHDVMKKAIKEYHDNCQPLEYFVIELTRDTGAQQEALEKMLKEDPSP